MTAFKNLLIVMIVSLILIRFRARSMPKIISGSKTYIERFPFMVGVFYFDEYLCGGTIISSRIVLTAGHCVCEDFTVPDSVFIHAGASQFSSPADHIYYISSIKCHDAISIKQHRNDIALIKICGKFEAFHGLARIPLIGDGVVMPVGTLCRVIGWGHTQQDQRHFTPTLRETQVPLINVQACMQMYLPLNITVTTDMMCAGFKHGGPDACQGDSGGPLVYRGVQIGIISFGNKCGAPDYAGVYTDLHRYAQWIRQTTKTI